MLGISSISLQHVYEACLNLSTVSLKKTSSVCAIMRGTAACQSRSAINQKKWRIRNWWFNFFHLSKKKKMVTDEFEIEAKFRLNQILGWGSNVISAPNNLDLTTRTSSIWMVYQNYYWVLGTKLNLLSMIKRKKKKECPWKNDYDVEVIPSLVLVIVDTQIIYLMCMFVWTPIKCLG